MHEALTVALILLRHGHDHRRHLRGRLRQIQGPLDTTNADKAFKRILKDAELPLHFTPHCLRHTFASLLLQQGESPAYVQRQLGHASIQLTVDTYGRWLPMGNKAAVDSSTTRLREQVAAKW